MSIAIEKLHDKLVFQLARNFSFRKLFYQKPCVNFLDTHYLSNSSYNLRKNLCQHIEQIISSKNKDENYLREVFR